MSCARVCVMPLCVCHVCESHYIDEHRLFFMLGFQRGRCAEIIKPRANEHQCCEWSGVCPGLFQSQNYNPESCVYGREPLSGYLIVSHWLVFHLAHSGFDVHHQCLVRSATLQH